MSKDSNLFVPGTSEEDELDYQTLYDTEIERRKKAERDNIAMAGKISELTSLLEKARNDAGSFHRQVDAQLMIIARLSGYIDRVKEIEGNLKPIQSNLNVATEELPRGYYPEQRNY